jgi:hypothetical protein
VFAQSNDVWNPEWDQFRLTPYDQEAIDGIKEVQDLMRGRESIIQGYLAQQADWAKSPKWWRYISVEANRVFAHSSGIFCLPMSDDSYIMFGHAVKHFYSLYWCCSSSTLESIKSHLNEGSLF